MSESPEGKVVGAQRDDSTPSEVTLWRRLVEYWPRHRDKVMYLLVGGVNTLFTYGCFALIYHLLHEYVPSPVILIITYLIVSVVGFFTMRMLVFKPARHPLIEYLRYQAVYVPLLLINVIVLPLALRYTDLNAYVIQAMFAAFAVVAGYLGNKYFAFRKSRS